MTMKVLSLFDGISCGYLALQRAGIPVDYYYASEIDRKAIDVSRRHFSGHHPAWRREQLADLGYSMEGNRIGDWRILLPELLLFREGEGIHGCERKVVLLFR